MKKHLVMVGLVAFGLSFASGRLSSAGQKTIVLDPGHGGDQPGAKSADGVLEKNIVLAVAQAAKTQLERKGWRVLLTRSTDATVGLKSRTEFANRHQAQLFVSIHANYAPIPERRGTECYILSVEASDEDALALLRLEEGELEGGVVDEDKSDPTSFILADLGRHAAHRDSARLARTLQSALGQVSAFKPARGLRQAPFRVLRGAQMPAVLVELAYLSNPSQGVYLGRPEGQQKAGQAIAQGILKFIGSDG